MKRAERHRLKQNQLGVLTKQVRNTLEGRKSQLTPALIGLAVLVVAVIGYLVWRDRVQDKAQVMLADALVVQEARVGPPAEATGSTGLTFPTERDRAQAALEKFKAAADAYPSTDAGLFARYQEAATQMSVGNPGEAVKAYQQVVDRAGDRIYGQMARLGIAEAHARGGQYEQAINTFKELAQRKDGELPIDGILMQLGRTYVEAGKAPEARQTFNRLIEEFPDSPFSQEARRELDGLKKS